MADVLGGMHSCGVRLGTVASEELREEVRAVERHVRTKRRHPPTKATELREALET